MITTTTRSVLALSLLFAVGSQAADNQQGLDWQLFDQTKAGVNSYRLQEADSEFETFKGVAFIDAKIETVGAVLRDIPSYNQWMAKFKSTKVLNTIDRDTYQFYAIIKTPFPYKNRDLVIENTTSYDFNNGTASLKFWADDQGLYPEQKGLLRVTDTQGSYLLEYFGRDKTRVTYQYRANPGGNIPVSLANEIEVKHYPRVTLENLKKMVVKEQYIKEGERSPEHDKIEQMLSSRNDVQRILTNRLAEYVTDPAVLELVFAMPQVQKQVDAVYEQRASFDSVKSAMVQLFNVLVDAGEEGTELRAYLQDKNLADAILLDKFLQETWLLDELKQDPQFAHLNSREDLENIFQIKVKS